jgi:hypothetical protein
MPWQPIKGPHSTKICTGLTNRHMSRDIAEGAAMSPATKATGSGPLLGLIRRIYCQTRLALPSDPDLRDSIEQIFGQPNRVGPNDETISTMKDDIDSQHASLRASYNRFHFVHSNFLYFHPDDLTRSEKQYEAEKANFTDHRDSTLKRTEREFEKILTRKRYTYILNHN